MEAFSLLKYWRTSTTTTTTTTNAGHATTNADVSTSTATATTTIVTAVTTQPSESGDEEDDNDDNGPFFDLEFSLPVEEDEAEEEQEQKEAAENNYCEEDKDEDDCSDGSSGESTEDVNISVSVSPSDELFFNDGFVPVEQIEKNIKPKSLSRPSLLKPATKFRVMMLKFKNLSSNADSIENTDSNCKEESRNGSKAQKKLQNDVESVSASSDEKKFSKETMQRYLRKVKPLYVRVSKRYGTAITKAKLEHETDECKDSLMTNGTIEKESKLEVSEPALVNNNNNVKALKQGNIPAGLRVVCKQLRKSRSGFTAVAAAPPGVVLSNRRDDSLLQQQDGIQSAILHCKRSFKASRDSDCSPSSGGDPAPPDGNNISSDASEEKEKEEETKKGD